VVKSNIILDPIHRGTTLKFRLYILHAGQGTNKPIIGSFLDNYL